MQRTLLRHRLGQCVALGLALTSSLTALAGGPARRTATAPPAVSSAAPRLAAPLANLSGTYYVGTGTSPNPTNTFATLTAAAAAYNGGTLTGAVTFVLLDASYSAAETFPIIFNSNTTASATNTLTIKPNTGVSPTISGSVATGSVLELFGADYIIIDGSNAGTATRNLTITNTSATGTNNAVLWIAAASATDGATNNVVRNTNITGNANTGNPQFTVFMGGGGTATGPSTTATTPAANSNNSLSNNAINRGYYGVFMLGGSATALDQNNSLTGNQIGQTGTGNGFNTEGVRASFQQGLTVQANEIQNVVSASAASHYGINLLTCKGANITRNAIHDVQSNNTTTGYVGYGIELAATAFNTSANASGNTVSNNIIYNISAPLAGTGSFPNVLGVANNGGYGDRIVFNTILLNVAQTAGTGTSAAISNGDTQNSTASAALDVRNNILALTANVSTTANYYGFYTSAANVTGSTLDYNDYYLASAGSATFSVGYVNFTASSTLAAWQTATGQEANSKNVNPQFTQTISVPFNLTPSSGVINNVGTPITGITVDYNGATRGTPPDIGAIEFAPAALDLKPNDLTSPAATQICFSASDPLTVQIQNNGGSAINFASNTGTVTVVVTPPTGPAQTYTTTLTTGTLAAGATQSVTLPGTVNLTATGTYSFAITATVAGDGNTGNDNITVVRTNGAAGTTLPYTEAFNATTLPTGFTTTGFFLSTAANNGGATGSNGLRVNIYSFNTTASATTPVLGPVVSANNLLTFDARFTNYTGGAGTPLQNDKVDVQVAVCGGAFTTVYTITGTNQNGTGTTSTNFYNYSVPLPGLTAGQRIQVRLLATYGGTSSNDFYVDVDNLNIVSLVPVDLAANALVAPTATQGCYTAAETVTVRVRNAGSTAINFATNPATVSVSIAGPGTPGTLAPVTISTGTLAVGATQNVTFVGTANLLALGTYTFTITGTVTGDGNTANDVLAPAPTITVAAPVAGTLSPATVNICQSGSTTLTLGGSANGTIQYQSSSSATGPFTNITGATSAAYTTPVLTTTTYYRAQVTCGANVVTSNVTAVTINNPSAITVTTPVTACAGSPATLTATVPAGSTTAVRFYATATGGTPLTTTTTTGNTTTATTGNVTASTTFYAEAYVPNGSSEAVGKPSTNGADGTNTIGGLYFTATAATTIQTVTVYRTANAAAGTATIQLLSGSTTTGTPITQVTVNVPANTTAAVSPTVLTLNFAVPAAGQYTLYLSAATPSLIRDYSAAVVPAIAYPYNSPSGRVSITDGTLTGFYYFFYNWQVGSDCANSTRTPIQVNVTPLPTANFSYPTATSCAGTATTLTPTLATGATAGTFTLPAATGLTINATTGVVTVAATAAAGTYTVTNTVSTSCGTPVTSTATFTLSAAPTSAFSYTGSPFCANGANPTATITGTAGGTFSSATGLTISATTGAITLSSSTPGTYVVTYTVTTPCGTSSSSQSVTVTAPRTAGFTYLPSSACAGSTTPVTVTLLSGGTAGTFTVVPATGLTVDATTGALNLTNAVAGTYTITNTVAASGGCSSAVNTATFTVNAAPVAPVLSSSANPTGGILLTSSVATGNQFYRNNVLVPGATGQTFVVNSGTLNGTYTVVITNAAGCSATSNAVTVTVTATAPASAGTSLTLYPNPTRDGLLTLELSGYRETVQLSIVNALGQKVYEGTVTGSALNQKQALNLSGLATGVYTLQARTASGSVETRRLVRE